MHVCGTLLGVGDALDAGASYWSRAVPRGRNAEILSGSHRASDAHCYAQAGTWLALDCLDGPGSTGAANARLLVRDMLLPDGSVRLPAPPRPRQPGSVHSLDAGAVRPCVAQPRNRRPELLVHVWIDLANSPHVAMFEPIVERLRADGRLRTDPSPRDHAVADRCVWWRIIARRRTRRAGSRRPGRSWARTGTAPIVLGAEGRRGDSSARVPLPDSGGASSSCTGRHDDGLRISAGEPSEFRLADTVVAPGFTRSCGAREPGKRPSLCGFSRKNCRAHEPDPASRARPRSRQDHRRLPPCSRGGSTTAKGKTSNSSAVLLKPPPATTSTLRSPAPAISESGIRPAGRPPERPIAGRALLAFAATG